MLGLNRSKRSKHWLLAAALLALAGEASAASEEADLLVAAKLHRAGETGAAVAIWSRWASQGSVDAAYNLAVVHQYGDGVPQDSSLALKWYRYAAERNDRPAQFQLGLMYQTGEGVAVDAQEAHEWFTRHRRDRMTHANRPQMRAWREQAVALIEDRDRREAYAASRLGGAQVLAELRRRAGMPTAEATVLAAR